MIREHENCYWFRLTIHSALCSVLDRDPRIEVVGSAGSAGSQSQRTSDVIQNSHSVVTVVQTQLIEWLPWARPRCALWRTHKDSTCNHCLQNLVRKIKCAYIDLQMREPIAISVRGANWSGGGAFRQQVFNIKPYIMNALHINLSKSFLNLFLNASLLNWDSLSWTHDPSDDMS